MVHITMAKFIKTDGSIINVEPKNGKDFSLKELQGFVDGYIEIVYLPNGDLMVVNEEGKMNDLPINMKATMAYGLDVIVGNVLWCNKSQVK
jgi:hypothetical protein